MTSKKYHIHEAGPYTAALFKFYHLDQECLQIEFFEAKYRSAPCAFRTFSNTEALQFRDALNEMFPEK